MPAPKGASIIFKSKLGLLGHHVLDHANNCQSRAATDAATGNLRDKACDIKFASSRATSHDHRQNLSHNTTADDTSDRIAQCLQRQALHHAARDIAADCTRDQLNNQLFQLFIPFIQTHYFFSASTGPTAAHHKINRCRLSVHHEYGWLLRVADGRERGKSAC
ncbi:MAG: hypothetical protein ACJAVT_000504 [Yoonia sp.]|jgi:hypothetical protein